MATKILVPYDGSTPSEQALQAAVDTFAEASLVVLSVVEPVSAYLDAGPGVGEHREAIEEAERSLAAAVEDLPAEVSVETAVVTGRPVHEIVRYADANAVSHIVMGSHGRDGAERLLLGSVAETVLRRASVPVTVVREDGASEGRRGRVLVPFDGSSESRRALGYALEQYPDAETTALYVVYPPKEAFDTGGDESGFNPDEFAANILSMAESEANRRDQQLAVDTAEGSPAEAIVDYVEATDIDHVVMGSHGRDGLTRLLLGSVAETVARRSPTSVTVVR